MRKWIAALAASAVLAGCDGTQKAKDLVAATMKDPSSVQFREVERGAAGYVCGEINAKNEYGAYGGFRGFMVSDSGRITMWGEMNNLPRWQLNCWPKQIKSKAQRDSLVKLMAVEDDKLRQLDSLNRELERVNQMLNAVRR